MIYIILAVILLLIVGAYFLFRDTMNKLQYIGPVYWITRDNGSPDEPHIQRHAFCFGTSPPWKISDTGIKFRWATHTFQIGTCHNAPLKDPTDEIEGLEYVLGYHDVEA